VKRNRYVSYKSNESGRPSIVRSTAVLGQTSVKELSGVARGSVMALTDQQIIDQSISTRRTTPLLFRRSLRRSMSPSARCSAHYCALVELSEVNYGT